jgi:hypothetical protein
MDTRFWGLGFRELRWSTEMVISAFRSLLLRVEGDYLIRYFGGDSDVTVIREIERFCRLSFSNMEIDGISFDGDSQLHRIDSRAFMGGGFLEVVCIRRFVDWQPDWTIKFESVRESATNHSEMASTDEGMRID